MVRLFQLGLLLLLLQYMLLLALLNLRKVLLHLLLMSLFLLLLMLKKPLLLKFLLMLLLLLELLLHLLFRQLRLSLYLLRCSVHLHRDLLSLLSLRALHRNLRSLSLLGGHRHGGSVLHRTCGLCQDLGVDQALKLLRVQLTLMAWSRV